VITAINLRERFGKRFKVAYAPDYYAEYGPDAITVDPWYMEILCQHGIIGPWDETHLMACTRTAGPVCKALKALPFVRVHQDGTDGGNLVFPVAKFDEVAALMKPRKRRHLSDEAKAKAIQNLVPFPKKASVAVVEPSPEGRECVREAPVDTLGPKRSTSRP
jgi:hypothetical protein